MSDIIIHTEKLSKTYNIFNNPWERLWHSFYQSHRDNKNEITALKDINLKIKKGELIGIIGLNGSGKTTLLEILTGTLKPSSGKMVVNGRVSALLELGSGFNPEYSGKDNVILNGLLLGLKKEEILQRFPEIEDFAEIGAAINNPVKTYSSGMVLRLAFAVQVLCKPEILIVDEALSVGDFFFQQKCFKYIRKLADNGVTLLFVSHDMSTVRDISQRVLLMKNGEITYDGEPVKALQHFLNKSSEKNPIKIKENNLNFNSKINLLPNSIWKFEKDKKSFSKARILEVGIYNKYNEATTNFKIGDTLTLLINYEVFCDIPVHVGFSIKNKYNQLINTSNSYSLLISPPKKSQGGRFQFASDITLNIEAGKYSILIKLGSEGKNINEGDNLFETTWIGPIDVNWNYNSDISPFYGMFGLPVKGRFNIDNTQK